MSEQTGDGNKRPDPEQEPVFNDPAAPVWADPTAPVPATPSAETPAASTQDTPTAPDVPPAPPGSAYPYGQQPAAPEPSPPAAPPVSNPYAQQPPAPTYGQQPPAPTYGQPTSYAQQPPAPTYGQPQPGQQYPAYGQQTYATGAPSTPANTSAIILTILSFLSLCNILAIGSLVLGIMALTKSSTDPEGSRRSAKIGWIVFAVSWVIAIVGFVGVVALGIATGNNGTYNFDSGY